MSTMIQTVENLLNDREAFTRRLHADERLAGVARVTIATIAGGGAVFGACIGAWRGGAQVLYAGIKLPLVLLLTASVCAPALTALNAALDRPASLRRDLALVLGALALGSLVLFACAPLVLLAVHLGVGYHALALVVSGCCAVAGITAVGFLSGGLIRSARARAVPVIAALALVFALVGAQMSWTLRPYLVRPRTPEPPFVRAVEGSLFDSVARSFDSARGVYHRGEP
jgi:hypothetical protein